MREYPLSLKGSLGAGIRRDHRLGRNMPGLLECVNLKPLDGSLVFAEAPTQPFPTPPTVQWPYPQLIRGKGKTILAGRSALQYVDEAKWGLTDIPVYNLAGGLNDLIVNGAFSTDPDTGPTWRYGDQWAWANNRMERTQGEGDPILGGERIVDEKDRTLDDGEGGGSFNNWTPIQGAYAVPSDTGGSGNGPSIWFKETNFVLIGMQLTEEHFVGGAIPTGQTVKVTIFVRVGGDRVSESNPFTLQCKAYYGGNARGTGGPTSWTTVGIKSFSAVFDITDTEPLADRIRIERTHGGGILSPLAYIDDVSIKTVIGYDPIGPDNLYQLFTDMESVPVEGKRYKVTYTVTRSAGTVTMALGGTSGTARSAAGTYTDVVECGPGDRINFLASETFNGSVDLVKIMEDIQSGGVNGWHFMDFFEVWALFNTESTVFVLKRSALGGNDVAQVQSEVTIKTGCAHRGRAVMGGFDASNFWKSEWVTFWNDWISSMGLSLPTISETGPGGNFVMWSTIGGGDVFSMLFPATAQEGLVGSPTVDGSLGDSVGGASGSQTAITDPYATGEEIHSADRPLIFDLFERGEWGLMPMPWQGSVLHVRPLSEGVMVYGEDGVAALTLFPGDGDVPPTYGLKELGIRTGIKSRDAVGGDEKGHVYVDAKGTLCAVGASLEPVRLGYQDIFGGLSNLIISHDPVENEFYISDGYSCYVLTKDGLGSVNMPVSSLVHIDDTLYAPNMELSGDTMLCSFKSDTFDMGVSGMKTIRVVKVAADLLYNMRVIIHYCNDSEGGEFEEAEPTSFNEAGVAYPGITAHFFRVEVVGERKPDEYPSVSDIDVGWCLVDKRYTRGVYAN